MGQLYDGVYDVLANLLLTPRSVQTFFLPPHHVGRPTRPSGRKTKAWLRSKKEGWVVKIRGGELQLILYYGPTMEALSYRET